MEGFGAPSDRNRLPSEVDAQWVFFCQPCETHAAVIVAVSAPGPLWAALVRRSVVWGCLIGSVLVQMSKCGCLLGGPSVCL